MKEKQLENKEEIMEINTWIKKKLKMYFLKVEQKRWSWKADEKRNAKSWNLSKRVNITNILDTKI